MICDECLEDKKAEKVFILKDKNTGETMQVCEECMNKLYKKVNTLN